MHHNYNMVIFITLLTEEFILEDPKTYVFLSSGGHLPVPGVDDVVEFQSTCKAMGIMGLTGDDFSGRRLECCIVNRLYY